MGNGIEADEPPEGRQSGLNGQGGRSAGTVRGYRGRIVATAWNGPDLPAVRLRGPANPRVFVKQITDGVDVGGRRRDERRIHPYRVGLMITVVEASSRSGFVMRVDVPVDHLGVPTVRSLDGVHVLGRKNGQAKQTKHCEARRESAQVTVQHHRALSGPPALESNRCNDRAK
jgi:hypothetical protein